MKQYPLTARDRLEQACGDARPAPTVDGGTPGGGAELGARFGGKSEQLVQLRREVTGVAVREARELPVLGWVLGFQALCDLCEPRVTSDQRRRACGSRFRCDHSE